MHRSEASEHYRELLDWHGTPEERRAVSRPMGFQRPKSVEARGPLPTGIETQTWEAWMENEE